MKTNYAILYFLLGIPTLLISQFQEPYTFYTIDGDSLSAAKLVVGFAENNRVKSFNIGDQILPIDQILAFSERDNYYELADYNDQGSLNLLKRYWQNEKMQLFYNHTLKVASYPHLEIVTTKDLFYRKDQGTIRLLNYQHLVEDIDPPTNQSVGKIMSKIENVKKQRKIVNWLNAGSILVTLYYLNRNQTLGPVPFLPPILIGVSLLTRNKEKRLLEEAVKLY